MNGPLADSPPETPQHDIELIREHFRRKGYSQVEILGQNFMANSSRDFYNAHWILRESLQNFNDANKDFPETINGVGIEVNDVDSDNAELTITGNWPYKDSTHLMVMGSMKESATNAGGNGGGIKQVGIMLLQDNDDCSFEIEGEGWQVGYIKVDKKEISSLEKEPWIIACKRASKNTGSCTYRIKLPKKHELFQAVKEAHDMFICDENSYMETPDFTSPNLTIKWGENRDTMGRLFIAGQVTSYEERISEKKKEQKEKTSFSGPYGLSMAISGVDTIAAQRTLDRGPKSTEQLEELLGDATKNLSLEDCIHIIQSGEHIWSGDEDANKFWEKEGYIGLLYTIISRLRWHHHCEDIMQYLPDKKFAACSENVDINKKVKAKGYILCPSHFGQIGMPTVEEVAGIHGIAEEKGPVKEQYILGQYGIHIHHNTLDTQYKRYWKTWEEMGEWKHKIDTETGIETAYFGCDLSTHKKALTQARVQNKMVQNIRNMIGTGLEKGWLKMPCFCTIGKEIFTFGYDAEDGLMMRVSELGNDASQPGIHLTSGHSQGDEEKSKINFPRFLGNPYFIASAACVALLGSALLVSQKKEGNQNTSARIGDIIGYKQILPPDPLSATALKNNEIFEKAKAKLPVITRTGKKIDQIIKERTGYDVLPQKEKRIKMPTQEGTSDVIENFEIVENPSLEDQKKLNSVITFTCLATGVEIEGSFFIFRGDGALGVNMGKRGIGLHEEVIKGSFFDALPIVFHEFAHMHELNHGIDFIHAVQSLMGSALQNYDEIERKRVSGEKLSINEELLLQQVTIWGKNTIENK